MNLTDVDDKTIKGSQKEGTSLKDYTERYKKAFFEDIEKLNIEKAEFYPEATNNIKEMKGIIKKLLEKKIAYIGDDKSIYYSISKFKDYGNLSKIKLKGLKAGARVNQDEYEKENVSDFALWKAWDKNDGDVFWESDFGKGRPGWHIECSAMSIKYLGETFDIHAGGVDLIFPHHENEIAQSEGATGKKFANFWLHNEHLLVDGKKMSKSLGNFYTLRDLLEKGHNPASIRYLLLATHYRQKLNFSFKGLESADNAVERINNFIFNLKNAKSGNSKSNVDSLIGKAEKDFEKCMDDDLNISEALGVIFDFIREINKSDISQKSADKIIKTMKKFDGVLGILEEKEDKITENIESLIREREEARKKKDFKKADEIRDNLKEKGIILEDSKDGVRWKNS